MAGDETFNVSISEALEAAAASALTGNIALQQNTAQCCTLHCDVACHLFFLLASFVAKER